MIISLVAAIVLNGTLNDNTALTVMLQEGSVYEVSSDAAHHKLPIKFPDKFVEAHDGAPVWVEKGELVTYRNGAVKPITFSKVGDQVLLKMLEPESIFGIAICQEEDMIREIDFDASKVKFWRLSTGSLLKTINSLPLFSTGQLGQVIIPPKTLWPGRKSQTENYELAFADPTKKSIVLPDSFSSLLCSTFLLAKDGTVYILGNEEKEGAILASYHPATKHTEIKQIDWPKESIFRDQFLVEIDGGVIASIVAAKEIHSVQFSKGKTISLKPVALPINSSYKHPLSTQQMRSGEAVIVHESGVGVFDARLNRLIWKNW